MRKEFFNRYYFKLFVLFLLSFLIDYTWLNNTNSIPGWDQGYHLSNAFKMHNIFDFYKNDYEVLWNNLLKVTDSYRGPLTYFFSSLFLKIFGISYNNAYLSNHIFSLICIYSIFELGKILLNKSAGLWAAILFTFSPLVFSYRTDYLIDLSLTAFVTLTFLFITRWFLCHKNFSIYSVMTGLAFGFVFLVKPTGIVLLLIPLGITIARRIYQNRRKLSTIGELILLSSTFLLIIYPWFSQNWLTILSSIINAWQWGIKYQEGFEISDIESWLYYIFRIPSIFGKPTFWTLIIIFLYKIFYIKNEPIFNIKSSKKTHLLYLSFFLNVYLITSFMSTKEVRFFLPIFPLICIYLSIFLNFKNKLKDLIFKRIFLIILISTLISYQYSLGGYFSFFKNNNAKKTNYYLNKEIIDEITEGNNYLTTTLAVLPDTRAINTFNLEAEASKEGEYVAVRQIISNKNTYNYDLENFDWFLIKTGYQGIMKNEAKELIERKLYDNETFEIEKQWQLPDKSYLRLIKRKSPTVILEKSICKNNKPKINIKRIDNGLKLIFNGTGKDLKSSKILLDINTNNNIYQENISLANGMFHPDFSENDCYLIEQNVPIIFNPIKDNSKKLDIDIFFINEFGEIIIKEKKIIKGIESNSKKSYLMANKIEKVKQLGLNLKFGQFDQLFKLVEILNQSDPKQIYLKDAEDIFEIRYDIDKKEADIYSILISQILQRKINDAKSTTDKIIKNHNDLNQNLYISKALINLYLLNIKDARLSINKAKSLSNSVNNSEIINMIENFLNFFIFKII